MTAHYVFGDVVQSRAGHDCGRLFVVMADEQDGYALLCDGRLRTIDKPKRKKAKHIVLVGGVPRFEKCAEYPKMLDAHIKKHLDFCRSLCYNKEV